MDIQMEMDMPSPEMKTESMEMDIETTEEPTMDMPKTVDNEPDMEANMDSEPNESQEMEAPEEDVGESKLESEPEPEQQEETEEPEPEKVEQEAEETEAEPTESEPEPEKEIEEPKEEPTAKQKAATKIVKNMGDKGRYEEGNQIKTLIVMQVLGNTKTFFESNIILQGVEGFFTNEALPDTMIPTNNMAQYFLFGGSNSLMDQLVDSQYK